jgi:predicted nucleic acid-binding protein
VSKVVVDSSVLLAVILRQPEAERVKADIARWALANRRIHVPGHFWLEVVNALTRRHHFTGAQVLEAIHDLDKIGLETVALDRALLLSTNDLVERYGLTAYDAGYLALAWALGASFATFDDELRVAGADIVDSAYVAGTERRSRLSEERAPYGEPAAVERPVTWPQWSGAGAYLGTLRRRALADAEAANAAAEAANARRG